MSVKLTGTLYPQPGVAYRVDYPLANAFDGDVNSFTHVDGGIGVWGGLTLATPAYVQEVRYSPRPSLGTRLVGGTFQGAMQADWSDAVTLVTVTSAPPSGMLTSQPIATQGPFKHLRYVSPPGLSTEFDVAEIQFWGTESPAGWRIGSRGIVFPGGAQ